VLAVVSQKGGVGKTTTSVNLAAAFARRGLKTLVVDVDPQGAVRYGVGLKRGHPPHGFSDYLNGARGLREVILPTALPWLRVMLAGTVSDAADHGTYHALVAETDVLKELLTAARERCDVVARIPMRGHVASLNVGAAAAIACATVARLRTASL